MKMPMKNLLLISALTTSALVFGCNDYALLVPPGTSADSKLSICHVTGKAGKYQLISVKASAAQAHADHGDFLAPAGATRNSDCVDPSTVPPVTPPPVAVPPVAVPPAAVPPAAVPDTTSVVDTIVDAVKQLPDEIKDIPCIVDPSQPQCQL